MNWEIRINVFLVHRDSSGDQLMHSHFQALDLHIGRPGENLKSSHLWNVLPIVTWYTVSRSDTDKAQLLAQLLPTWLKGETESAYFYISQLLLCCV